MLIKRELSFEADPQPWSVGDASPENFREFQRAPEEDAVSRTQGKQKRRQSITCSC